MGPLEWELDDRNAENDEDQEENEENQKDNLIKGTSYRITRNANLKELKTLKLTCLILIFYQLQKYKLTITISNLNPAKEF